MVVQIQTICKEKHIFYACLGEIKSGCGYAQFKGHNRLCHIDDVQDPCIGIGITPRNVKLSLYLLQKSLGHLLHRLTRLQ
jgi:hypothetical protein